ncbi:type II toxin-antitoxin system ParD family antitoxin [Nitrospira sp. M1]
MAQNTSIILGEHFDQFTSTQVQKGRYGSASEVIRQGLRFLEEHEQKVIALREALIAGEKSGDAGRLDMEEIRKSAKKKAGLKR